MQHNTKGFGVIGRTLYLAHTTLDGALNKAVMVKLNAISRSLDIQQTWDITSLKSDLINSLIPFEIFITVRLLHSPVLQMFIGPQRLTMKVAGLFFLYFSSSFTGKMAWIKERNRWLTRDRKGKHRFCPAKFCGVQYNLRMKTISLSDGEYAHPVQGPQHVAQIFFLQPSSCARTTGWRKMSPR